MRHDISLAATDSSNSVMGFMGVMGEEGRKRVKRELVKQERRGDRSQVQEWEDRSGGGREGNEWKGRKATRYYINKTHFPHSSPCLS